MKFLSKIEWVLEDDNFMKYSEEVAKKISISKEKRGNRFRNSDESRIINNQINKKLKNPSKIKGICVCKNDILCKHRKKYLKEIL